MLTLKATSSASGQSREERPRWQHFRYHQLSKDLSWKKSFFLSNPDGLACVPVKAKYFKVAISRHLKTFPFFSRTREKCPQCGMLSCGYREFCYTERGSKRPGCWQFISVWQIIRISADLTLILVSCAWIFLPIACSIFTHVHEYWCCICRANRLLMLSFCLFVKVSLSTTLHDKDDFLSLNA